MHALGIIVLTLAVQVTFVALAILLVLRLAGTSDPHWRGRIVLWGIGAVLVLTAMGASPWPSWAGVFASAPEAETESEAEVSTINAGTDLETKSADAPPPNQPPKIEAESPWVAGWSAFIERVQRPQSLDIEPAAQTEEASPSFSLMAWVGIVFLVGATLSLMRLFAGLALLKREVRRSEIVRDQRLTAQLQALLAGSAEADRPLEIRVTPRLKTAAMTGISRPVILLPACWETWSDDDLKAVLAHELSHVSRRDCMAALCAELARVLHFYHPLVHWLVNRLRLEQELAADAQASQSVGGQNRYLRILAEMALGEKSSKLAWPARAFLPSRRTLIRRIEMLKKTPARQERSSRFRRRAAGFTLALALLAVAGLRYQAGDARAQDSGTAATELAQAGTTNAESAKPDQPFSLTYVPDDAIAVIGVRPKKLMTNPSLAPLAEHIRKTDQMNTAFGISLDQLEHIVWSFGPKESNPATPMFIAAVIRSSKKLSLDRLKEALLQDSDTGFYGGQLYLTDDGGRDGTSFWLADEHTLIYSDSETGLKQAIDARNLSVNKPKRIPAWERVAKRTIAGYGNVGLLRKTLENAQRRFGADSGYGRGTRRPSGADNFAKVMGLNPMFGPLWNDVDTVVAGADLNDTAQADISVECTGEEGKRKVHDTLNAMLILGRNMIDQNQQMIGQLPEGERQVIAQLLTMGQEILKTVEVDSGQSSSKSVDISAELSAKATSTIVKALLPAVIAGQDAARRAQSMNNLKQIGLAFHNYHQAHNQFPSSVVYDPNGTPRSWRVELLPYLDNQALYQQYRKDEPWDSAHNKKLIEKMPLVFRNPKDDADSTNAGYFVLVGDKTALGDGKRPPKIRDITDGTSNTWLAVEAQREIPWTKPDDIAFDRSKPLPKLGGWFKKGFCTVYCDGSARFIGEDIDKQTQQNLIERNDGNPVNYDRPLNRPRGGRGFGSPDGEGGFGSSGAGSFDSGGASFDGSRRKSAAPENEAIGSGGFGDSSGESPDMER